MGLIILIVPLIIYYAIIVPMIKIQVINTKIQNTKLKNLAFIVLLAFPIGDHIIGYGVYKTLCYTNGGVKIYKTVTDEQEQRDYWIDTYNQYRPKHIIGNKYGIQGRNYLTKDLKYHKTIYVNNCKTKRRKSYDCTKAEEYIKNNNIDIYSYVKEEEVFSRNKKYTDYLEEASLKAIRLINDEKLILERAYFNKCNDEYNTLQKTDPNYKKSCKNAGEIIKKYNLKNVIKVQKSPYKYSNSWSRILPFGITFDTGKVINYKTHEVLGKNTEMTFWGGWYVNLISPFENHGERFNYLSGSDLQKLIIPNPYKIKNIKGK